MEVEEIAGVLAVYSTQDVPFNRCTMTLNKTWQMGRDDKDTTAMDMQGLENTVAIDEGNTQTTR